MTRTWTRPIKPTCDPVLHLTKANRDISWKFNCNEGHNNSSAPCAIFSIECFHMTSRRPYWCPKTMKRRPCWCPKPILWEFNSFLMQTLPFVPINLHRCWPREWKHSIEITSARIETKSAKDLLFALVLELCAGFRARASHASCRIVLRCTSLAWNEYQIYLGNGERLWKGREYDNCTMTSFYYNYQNPWVCCFLVQIKAIAL